MRFVRPGIYEYRFANGETERFFFAGRQTVTAAQHAEEVAARTPEQRARIAEWEARRETRGEPVAVRALGEPWETIEP